MKDYSFGNHICALRRRLGLSQFQLGALVGVSDKAVSKWENSDAKPKLATCFRLAEVLDVPIDELLSCRDYTTSIARKDFTRVNKKLWEQVYERLSIFGETPPALCWSRLAAEEAAFSETDAIQTFSILGQIEEAAQQNNSVFFASGSASSSFAAWLLGATKVNPLPPHYRCPTCGNTEFVFAATDGFDLPPKTCPCGEQFLSDGHNIPFEGVTKSEHRGTRVELRVSRKFKLIATEIIKSFYAGKADLVPVKLMVGDMPISIDKYVVMQGHKPKPTVSEDGFWHVEADVYQDWLDTETTFTLLINNQIDKIQEFQDKTNARCPALPHLITPRMIEHLYLQRCNQFSFITDCLQVNEPFDFDLLVRIDGFAHASGTWAENAIEEKQSSKIQELFGGLQTNFREIPILREDLWNDISAALHRNGIRDNGLALLVMEDVGKFGKYYFNGIPEHTEKLLLSLGLPKWYPSYLKKVLYLFPKGHCVDLLLVDAIYAWYDKNSQATSSISSQL